LDEETESLREYTKGSQEVISALADEIIALNMSERQMSLHNAIVAAGIDATVEEVAAITDLVNILEDKKEALLATTEAEKEAAKKAEDLEKASKEAAEEMRDQWLKTTKLF